MFFSFISSIISSIGLILTLLILAKAIGIYAYPAALLVYHSIDIMEISSPALIKIVIRSAEINAVKIIAFLIFPFAAVLPFFATKLAISGIIITKSEPMIVFGARAIGKTILLIQNQSAFMHIQQHYLSTTALDL